MTLPEIMRLVGGVLLFVTFIRMVFIGKAHHDRSGAPPLTPSFRPMAPDLMHKMSGVLKLGLIGGALFLLSYVFER